IVGRAQRDDRLADEIRRHAGQVIVMSFGPAVFDVDALAFDVPDFRQTFSESSYKWPIILRRSLMQKANYGSCRLLRPRRQRPRRCAAEQTDEGAPLHSVTSSAVNNSRGGISSPSAAAALRLITSSYLVGC